MGQAIYSKTVEACFYGCGGLAWKSFRAHSPIVVSNIAGGWDYFLFGTESNLRPWFRWVFGLLGHGTLSFDDGGCSGKGLMGARRDSLAEVYLDFFRKDKRHAGQPALVWVAGAYPVSRVTAGPEHTIMLEENKPSCTIFRAGDFQRQGQVSLGLLEGRRIALPAGLFRVPETKLSRAIVCERSRRMRELSTGHLLPFRQHHHEIQPGTPENARAIEQGDLLTGAHDGNIAPLGRSRAGDTYTENYTIRMVRLTPHLYAQARGLVGPTFRRYRMEQVYLSLRKSNACPMKAGTVFADFDCNVSYHPELIAALAILKQRQQGGSNGEDAV